MGYREKTTLIVLKDRFNLFLGRRRPFASTAFPSFGRHGRGRRRLGDQRLRLVIGVHGARQMPPMRRQKVPGEAVRRPGDGRELLRQLVSPVITRHAMR